MEESSRRTSFSTVLISSALLFALLATGSAFWLRRAFHLPAIGEAAERDYRLTREVTLVARAWLPEEARERVLEEWMGALESVAEGEVPFVLGPLVEVIAPQELRRYASTLARGAEEVLRAWGEEPWSRGALERALEEAWAEVPASVRMAAREAFLARIEGALDWEFREWVEEPWTTRTLPEGFLVVARGATVEEKHLQLLVRDPSFVEPAPWTLWVVYFGVIFLVYLGIGFLVWRWAPPFPERALAWQVRYHGFQFLYLFLRILVQRWAHPFGWAGALAACVLQVDRRKPSPKALPIFFWHFLLFPSDLFPTGPGLRELVPGLLAYAVFPAAGGNPLLWSALTFGAVLYLESELLYGWSFTETGRLLVLTTLAVAMISAAMNGFLNWLLPQPRADYRALTKPSHPLLKYLEEKAPGTFRHSLRVADLAERAAEAIGANASLARAGALFHDVGKASAPHYFIENLEQEEKNPHETVSESVSQGIIRQHVPSGVELARKYRLPEEVIRFILTHHGTSPVRELRLEQAAEPPVRYEGFLPETREEVLVMLADMLEAASQARQPKTEEELAALFCELLCRKFREGQLAKARITLAELDQAFHAMRPLLIPKSTRREDYPPP